MTKKIFSAVKANNGKKIKYGYGWGMTKIHKHKCIVHTGGWLGFNTIAVNVPKKKLWVVAFSNSQGISSSAAALQMFKYYLGIDPDK